jgi:hypothetical protein
MVTAYLLFISRNEENQGMMEKRKIDHVRRVYFNQTVSKYSTREPCSKVHYIKSQQGIVLSRGFTD